MSRLGDNRCDPYLKRAHQLSHAGSGWPGEDRWWTWLTTTINRYSPDRCPYAAAPDEPMDAGATLTMSLPWLPRIRSLGVPAAFVTQDGSEAVGLIPWARTDVLFIGGSTEWKLDPSAWSVARQAVDRGIPVHMGRVNSRAACNWPRI
ncbi:hypothetical protein ACFV0O_11815 [Kitasatospora sp. NPDC059577]|uniref:hypothetical protein n=1 Tax=Kitasatospora sp. NPDC059577 TaxID=3346873 RepID=UPI0036CA6F58